MRPTPPQAGIGGGGSFGNSAVPLGPPGTELLDAESGRKKSPPETANAHRDQEPRMRPAKIPAETAYFRLTTVGAVWEDWMVVCAVVCEPVSAAIPHWKPRQSAVFRFL